MRTGVADLPLHSGYCPPWLFKRMKELGKTIAEIIVSEYGRKEFLRRLSDPFFFQSLSCVLGFDWHSSGTTTVTLGALKEALDTEMGVVICGGKGRTARKTPEEIERVGEIFSFSTKKIEELKRASKMVAKVDNALLQDGHQIYHHSFILSEGGSWVVIQQGLNVDRRTARRYHWKDDIKSFVVEPHSGIVADRLETTVLDMTSKKSEEARKISVDLVNDGPEHIKSLIVEEQRSLKEFLTGQKYLRMPWKINWKKLYEAYELQPKNYEELISIKGIGPSTVRALALVSQLIFGKEPSWRDPAKYSYAHGGKDGVPYRVNTRRMEETNKILRDAIENAKIGRRDKIEALKRLSNFIR